MQNTMTDVEQIFKVSLEQEIRDVYYYQQIAHHKNEMIHKVPWGGALIRNSSPNGDLLRFKTLKEYEVFKKETNKQLWLLLPLKVFRYQDTMYGVYCCPQCDSMAGTDKLSVDQNPQDILSRLCMHSRVCSTIIEDWRTIWDIELSDNDRVVKIICNEDLKLHTFQKQAVDRCLIATVRTKSEIAVLYTVTTRQTSPLCSICVTRKCPHYHFHKKESKKEERQFESSVEGGSEDVCDCDMPDCGLNTNSSGIEKGTHANYWDMLPPEEHQKWYGYNFDPIPFPIQDNKEFQEKWLRRMQGNYDFPKLLIPEYKEGSKCKKHGNEYDASDETLLEESKTFVLYSEIGERVFHIQVFSRPTTGQCSCSDKFDGTDLLIWNLGQGRFTDFSLHFSYLHKWVNSGLKIFASWKSIRNNAAFSGISCTLTYSDLHRSTLGFMNNLDIDYKKAFSCPVHGNSPSWIVSDGKNLGPLKRKVDHLKELDRHESDKKILEQSTKFKDRCFLSEKKERTSVCKLITGGTTMLDFVETSDLTSPNGKMIIKLVRHIAVKFPDEIPPCYVSFLANISKPTSVRGLLQVLSPEPLEYLEQYCKEVLDVRSHTSQQQLQVL